MIHINKTKKGNFIVLSVADNGEILKSSEPLKSKQAAWKNIKAELKSCYVKGAFSFVQDNTVKNTKVWSVGGKRVLANGIKPQELP